VKSVSVCFCLFQLGNLPIVLDGFTFSAPTTGLNASCVLRALQLKKPILLEGSPGVGKTSLVAALAKAAGHQLTRINVSDQTVSVTDQSKKCLFPYFQS
jgi:midasin